MALLAESPDNAELHAFMGILLTEMERDGEAIAAFEEALKITADLDEAHHALGLVYLKQEKFKLALYHLQLAIEANPYEAIYMGSLSRLYMLKGEARKTREYAEKGLALDPNDESCKNSLFWAHFILGDYDKAEQTIAENLALNPENIESLISHGNHLLLNDKYEEAEELFVSLIKIAPNDSMIIEGIKEAATGNNSLSRWMDSKKAESAVKVVYYILIGVIFYARYLFDAPYRLYWVMALFIVATPGLTGLSSGLGKLWAYKRQKWLRAEYHASELVMGLLSPILFSLNLWIIWLSSVELAGDGPFPARLFVLSIYLSILQLVIGVKVDDNLRETSWWSFIRGLFVAALALCSILIEGFLWQGLGLTLLVMLILVVRKFMPFIKAGSLGKLWHKVNE